MDAVEPGRSKTIDFDDFVELAEIDPIYFQKTYYLPRRARARCARTCCCTAR
jgi:DNA end-binding protein Ku